MSQILLYSTNEAVNRSCQNLGQDLNFTLVPVSNICDFLLALANNGFQVALFDCELEKSDVVRWTQLVLRIRPKLNLIIFRNPAIQLIDAKLHELGVFFVSSSPSERNFEDVLIAALKLSKAMK